MHFVPVVQLIKLVSNFSLNKVILVSKALIVYLPPNFDSIIEFHYDGC